MATATKICKVCGKEYEYCHTVRRVEGVFRWQDVACCPEHGSTYLAEVIASRTSNSPQKKDSKKKSVSTSKKVANYEDLDDDEDEFEDEDDFDEDDDFE